MPFLFSYGTLQDKHVQLELFGRRLAGHMDYLLGYEQSRARVADPEFARKSGKTQHAILRPTTDPSARVEGMALEVTDAELKVIDAYEPVEYQRVLANLASGATTWVYVDAGSAGQDA